MRQWERESHPLHTDERWAGDLLPTFAVAGLFKDLLQSAHLPGFFKEQPHSFLEVSQGLLLASATRGNVKFQGMSDVGAPLFENPRCELNLHRGELRLALEG